jgi:hypothetical protein
MKDNDQPKKWIIKNLFKPNPKQTKIKYDILIKKKAKKRLD